MTPPPPTTAPEHGYVLAFDFGLRHIGLACGQTITGTASPLAVLAARDGRPDWPALLAAIEPWRPILLIVGLPLNMDDSESEMSARARAFARVLERRSGIATVLVDERLTTRAARESADAGGDGDHALAAALIAETWLSAR
ncbi:MAG: Holliday junction resolvase RuvX [Pseudomonadales bacterium]